MGVLIIINSEVAVNKIIDELLEADKNENARKNTQWSQEDFSRR